MILLSEDNDQSVLDKIQLLNTNSKSTAKARLKVVRGDKRSMGINAASLGVKDWQLLINDLKHHKIDIYIESVSLKSEVGIPE